MKDAFFKAIKQGGMDEVHRLISSNPSLINERENNLSPVMVAAYHQELEIAEYLATKAVSLSIYEASAMGKINQVIRHMARDVMLVNSYAEDGYQPLGLACFFGRYDTAEHLIKAGAAVNSPSKNYLNATPLHSATTAGHTKIVMLLLNHHANPNVREQGGYTPLHIAAQNGNTQMIRALLFNGADLNIQSDSGHLAVDLAQASNQKDAASLLKEGITRRFRQAKVH